MCGGVFGAEGGVVGDCEGAAGGGGCGGEYYEEGGGGGGGGGPGWWAQPETAETGEGQEAEEGGELCGCGVA